MRIDIKKNQQYYDSLTEQDSLGEDKIKTWWKSAIDFTFDEIDLNGKRILELGAGYGFFKEFDSFKPKKLYFTDIYYNRVKSNKYYSLFPESSYAIVNDAHFPCFKNNLFDAVLIANLLMLINDKEKFFENYLRILKNKGYLIIIDILGKNWFHSFYKTVIKRRVYKKISYDYIKYNQIEKICSQYKIVKKKYFYVFSILTAFLYIHRKNNYLIKRTHYLVEKLDNFLLKRFKLLEKKAVLCCLVLQKR